MVTVPSRDEEGNPDESDESAGSGAETPLTGAGFTVLVVDDEPMMRTFITRILEDEGYDVHEAEDALAAMGLLATLKPDLIMLDVSMPAIDGIELLDRIRKSDDLPIILVSGNAHEDDRVRGLKHGADDYVTKPFSPKELAARVETVLRRASRLAARNSDAGRDKGNLLEFGGLTIDKTSHEVRVEGKVVDFTAKEFELLVFLASSPRQVFNREQLLQHVWESSSDWQGDATVTEHVRRVRKKIEPDPDRPRHLVTVRGVGYRFEP